MKPPINAAFFDLGNVLINFDFTLAKQRMADRSPMSLEDIEKAFFRMPEFLDFECGRITAPEFFRALAEAVRFEGEPGELRPIFCEIFHPNTENIALVRELLPQMPVFLVSNSNEAHIEYIEARYDFLKELNHLFYSHRIMARKPEPRFYEIVLERSRQVAAHSVFIDDLETNLRAAAAAGFHTVQVVPGKTDLRAELRKLGLGV
ncbi:MAG: HAD family phosphatase [Verrucomicrobiae bacterium]|nr:HAD family phosphatase [Verrucomicrobiae bacterium]